MRECQLHRDSPLGDALLECYACGSRNAFALGFVPVRAEPCMLTREDVWCRWQRPGSSAVCMCVSTAQASHGPCPS